MYVFVWCPTCLKDRKHYVVREGQNPLLRCSICKTVHSATIEETKSIDVRVIISVDNLSFKRKIKLDPKNSVNVGDEYIIEDTVREGDEGGDISVGDSKAVEVTTIELKNGKREKSAKVKDIKTIWSRLIDDVVLKASIQKRGDVRSIRIRSPGNYNFVVGNTERIGEECFGISAVKMRDGRLLRQIGDVACARNIRRIYGRPVR